ncbi:MAG: DUF4760 domain-containing protein [Oceanicaulis sp.]
MDQSTFLDWAGFVLNALVLVVIVGSAIIAWKTLQDANKRARCSASFDHIARQTRDRELIEMFEEFRVVRRKVTDGKQNPVSIDDIEGLIIDHHRRALSAEDIIKKVFNYYEATAIGIREGALEEQIIKGWWRTSFVLDWADFSEYVRQRRKRYGIPKLFSEYEALVQKWAEGSEREKI